jgi:oligoribonuclease NrnB/cAMP/cGMP phosphodiesterase (DHH superfamily)
MKPLCIYHADCLDGFAAAWCVRAALGDNVEFYPGVYQQEPPPPDGRDLILVDFSYKRSVLDRMARAANSILILDHHKSAQEDLTGFPKPPPYEGWIGASYLPRGERCPIFALFDMDRSGAAMAWDYFIGDGFCLGWVGNHAVDRRKFIDYIQDRDLWRKELPYCDEFTIALRSYPFDFTVWDSLIDAGPRSLISEGHAIQRYYRLRVDEMKRSAYAATLAGIHCWISNAPLSMASEVAGELCERGGEFGACYSEIASGRFQYSLRSRGDFDVSKVARQFGGGGHKNAAGFTIEGGTIHL